MLARIRELAAQRKVRFTLKALRELAALDVGLDQEDACGVLMDLAFKPTAAGTVVYVKVVLRHDCVVISFHDEGDEGDASN